MFDRVVILAPGLLGASLALAIKERALARVIAIWGRHPQTRAYCAQQTWCDVVCTTPEEAVKEADFTIVCSPVGIIPSLVSRIAPHLKKGALVSDVGSTKNLIARRCHDAMPTGTRFVGSHPMAGSEKSGPTHARADLFPGKPCWITPLPESDSEAVETLSTFWKALGMEVVVARPERHDRIVANLSHLPHLLSTALCTYLATQKESESQFAGNGLRDTTRIAAGNPLLWQTIIEQNREEILHALDGFMVELKGLRKAIGEGKESEILRFLERGKAYRDHLYPASL